jgi:hypothetical protein
MFGLSLMSVLVGIILGWLVLPMLLGMVASKKKG